MRPRSQVLDTETQSGWIYAASFRVPSPMTDNDPIPLKEAAAFFKIGVSTLMSARKRGLLTTTKPGREIRTSLNDVREMYLRCQEEVKAPGFTVTRRAVNTSSETAAASLDSAQQALLKLRSTSRSTSPASTVQRQARGR
jgi:hypothetical protein